MNTVTRPRIPRDSGSLVALLCLTASAAFIAVFTPSFAVAIALGIAALLLGLLLTRRPGWFLMGILAYIWLVSGRADRGDLLEAYPVVRWATYVAIPCFLLLLAPRLLARRHAWRKNPVLILSVAIVLVTIVSGLVNRSGWQDIVASLAIYLRYPLLFLALVTIDLPGKAYLNVLKFMLWITVLLIVEAILNYLLFGKQQDFTFFTVGTTGGTLSAGILLLYASCFVIAHALYRGSRWYHWLFVALTLLVAAIAAIRSVFLILPLLFVAEWAIRYRLLGTHRYRWIAMLLLLALLSLAMLPWDQITVRFSFWGGFSPGDRLAAVQQVLTNLASEGSLALGFGPRSFSPGSLGEAGRMYQLIGEQRGIWWVANMAQTQFVNAFSELGLVGFTLYWLMLLAVLQMTMRFRSHIRGNRQYRAWMIASLAFAGIWLHYAVVGLAYYDLWRMDAPSLIFWTSAAAIYSEYRRGRVTVTQGIAS